MQAMHLFHEKKNLSVNAIILFCFPIFFIFLADSVMSYMFPIFVETTSNSNSLLGLVMALSSMLGALCDFTFPQLLRNRSWRFQLTAGIIFALLFPLFTHMGVAFLLLYFFIIATLIWGVYFEFLQFSQQNFVIGEDQSSEYSRDWGTIFFVYEVTAILGPIVGSLLLKQVLLIATANVNTIQIVSLLFAMMIIAVLPNKKPVKRESQIKQTLNLLKEIKYWHTLGERVWPAVISGILITFVSASYWTIGGLLGLEMAKGKGWDWLVLVLFGVPTMFGALILTKIPVTQKKKKYTQISLLVGGALLSGLFLFKSEPFVVCLVILCSSFALSFAGPLNEAVYSDLLERSGKSKLHLLGIAKSNASIAYVIAPLFTGFLSDHIDYYTTLSVVGGITACIALVLLLLSPRKIKLPQAELASMDIS